MSDLKRLSRDRYSDVLPINELYVCAQGEGSRAGMPTIAIRTTGCTHRCWFGEGGWCDSWYTSIHPEKGKYKFSDIVKIYDENDEISEMMLTGGSPTMHSTLVNELTHFANDRKIFITIETEGSHYLETDYPINLLSISPKFSNSIPKLGIETPLGNIVDKKMVAQHEKFRLNKEVIMKMITYHKDYQYKPVWDGTDLNMDEIEGFRLELGLSKKKTWLMPAGDNRKTLIQVYPKTMEMAIKMGYNFTGRPHIMAYDKKREV